MDVDERKNTIKPRSKQLSIAEQRQLLDEVKTLSTRTVRSNMHLLGSGVYFSNSAGFLIF